MTSPLLEEVQRARRATIGEEDSSPSIVPSEKGQINVELVNPSSSSAFFEAEEKQLIMSLNPLTLAFKSAELERGFGHHVGPYVLMLVEMGLLIVSMILMFLSDSIIWDLLFAFCLNRLLIQGFFFSFNLITTCPDFPATCHLSPRRGSFLFPLLFFAFPSL